MFCPKCNQQQPTETMRFCSRCGFPLVGVAILLQNDGVVPELSSAPAQKRGPSRKAIMIESAIFTLVAWMICLVAIFWFDYGGPVETVAKLAAFLFSTLGLIGVIRFLYGFVFAKDPVDHPTNYRLGNLASSHESLDAPNQFALPVQQTLTAEAFSKSGNTKEMVARPSVTEHTTRLLAEQPTDKSD
jgi:hypothetical protein